MTRPTLGPLVARWMESYLVHAEGDFLGQPFRLIPYERDFLERAYELDEDGSRWYDRALLGLPKGNGKTELAAAIAVAELGGPVEFDGWNEDGTPRGRRRTSPDIPVAAASFDQADTLFGAARTMIRQGPLRDYFEVYDTEIYPKGEGEAGTLYRVAAVAGTNDGRRPTFFVADELHEWEGKKERVHLVLSNGRAKRSNTWELGISTAGWDPESLLHRLYQLGKAGKDERFLFVWYEAGEDLDVEDLEENPEARERAIREANPAVGEFLAIDGIEARFHEIELHEWIRYYLNRWHAAPDQWIDADTWDRAAAPEREVPPATPVAIGFDGSYNQDSTALIGCTIEDIPHLFTLGVWEKPAKAKDWTVPESEVEDAIIEACARFAVKSLPADDTFGRIWSKLLNRLHENGIPVVEWPTRAPSRMAPACGQTWGAVRRGELTHDGDARLTNHVMNCRTKTDRWGPRIVKEHRGSTKHIDGAVAAVIAHDMAVRQAGERRHSWLLNDWR